MPTGYTADVADGKVTSLEDFILPLARGMGALVMMRDEPHDAPIPDSFEPSDYHEKRLEEARAEYKRLLSLDEMDVYSEVQEELQAYHLRKAKAKRDHDEQKARYEAMIEKVEAWKGAPEGIKGFALDQLRQGRDFDCREPFRFWGTEPETDPAKWLEAKFANLNREIEYHVKEQALENERVSQRNAWLKQLKESLK